VIRLWLDGWGEQGRDSVRGVKLALAEVGQGAEPGGGLQSAEPGQDRPQRVG
jgi:hypothetical protein